jgi:hypothetical protein
MTWSSSEMPDTIFTAGVRIRVIGAADFTMRRGNFVFATAFLTVMFVLVQREPIIAHALVRSRCVFTLVLTATVIDGALVHVCPVIKYKLNRLKEHDLEGEIIINYN